MMEDIVERRDALIEMLDEKNADRRAVYEQLESVNRMLGITDDPNLPDKAPSKEVVEWEAAIIRGGPLPEGLTKVPSFNKSPKKR